MFAILIIYYNTYKNIDWMHHTKYYAALFLLGWKI